MKTFVIKFGGSLFSNNVNRNKFWEDVKDLILAGNQVVIVHGGGKEITFWLETLNLETKFVNGLRYTDEKSVEVVEMVLSGKVNKQLTSELSRFGINCAGISGRDSNLIIAKKQDELGFVGKPEKVNAGFLQKLLNAGIIPIISPVSTTEIGEILNINADDAADVIATELKAEKLVFMTDMKGVMLDQNDEKSVVQILDKKLADELIEQKIITGGMLPKIKSSFKSLELGVEEVSIIDGREFGIIEKFLKNNEILGTRIVK